MIQNVLKMIFGSRNERLLKQYQRQVRAINALEPEITKLTDAELLGMPRILTISPRSLAAGGVEVTDRASGERSVRPMADVEAGLRG